MRRFIAVSAALLMIAGCSTSVTKVSADDLAKFKPGTTKETEVIAALGQPVHTSIQADGTKYDQYALDGHATSDSMWPSFMGGGSSSGTYTLVTFTISEDGVVTAIRGSGGK